MPVYRFAWVPFAALLAAPANAQLLDHIPAREFDEEPLGGPARPLVEHANQRAQPAIAVDRRPGGPRQEQVVDRFWLADHQRPVQFGGQLGVPASALAQRLGDPARPDQRGAGGLGVPGPVESPAGPWQVQL